MDALCAVQGDRLVVLLGGVDDPRARRGRRRRPVRRRARSWSARSADDLGQAHVSARAALAAHRAAPGWPEAPRPVRSDDLLPERALAGDGHARRHLVEEIYLPLLHARGTLIETLSAYFEHGLVDRGDRPRLFVHPNTVRYRLRQVADLTGFSPTDARDALTLQIALVLGRLSGRTS